MSDDNSATLSAASDLNENSTPITEVSEQLNNLSLAQQPVPRSIKLLGLLNPSNKFRYHDLLLSDYLSDYASSDTFATSFTVKQITWNLCGCKPPGSMPLKLANGKLANLYIFTFQETVSLRSLRKNNSVIDGWSDSILKKLGVNYSLVYSTGLLGLTTILIADEFVASQISDIHVQDVGLGYLNWYNKGAIILNFVIGRAGISKLGGTPFQVVNLHLTHGEDDRSLNYRIKNVEKVAASVPLVNDGVHLASTQIPFRDDVIRSLDLSDVELEKIAKASIGLSGISEPVNLQGVVIVAGDLNFRISDLDRNAILGEIASKDVRRLIDHDELANLMHQKLLFTGLKEGTVSFPPTYKIKGVYPDDVYDTKRRPGYTDRILYGGSIKQTAYGSLQILGTDHHLVYSEFAMKTRFIEPVAVKKHREAFENLYEHEIATMDLLAVEPKEVVRDCCAGFTEYAEFQFKNLCDERLTFKIDEQGKSFFHAATFDIPESGRVVDRKSKKLILFRAQPESPGVVTAKYDITLQRIPFEDVISIQLNVKTILGVPLMQLEDRQFDNLVRALNCVLSTKSKMRLTSRLLDIESSVDSLDQLERVFLKQITLATVDFDRVLALNSEGNKGSLALLDVVYLWLKLLPDINVGETRGKIVFSKLIDLIKFLDMSSSRAYDYFGFLFTDEYEILDYLESSVH